MRQGRLPVRQHAGEFPDEGPYREIFISETEGEAITLKHSLNVGTTLVSMADAIKILITDPDLTGLSSDSCMIRGKCNARDVLVTINISTKNCDEWGEPVIPINSTSVERSIGRKDILAFVVEVTGHRDDAGIIFKFLDDKYGKEKHAQIKWWYVGDGGREQYQTLFQPLLNTEILPEFYPGMGDPKRFLETYLNDEAAVLLLAGPAGTGKTTLLRHLIGDFRLSAHIVYDEDLMKRDRIFQAFLFERESDILVIEDADTILSSREHEGNKLMARFLNVSDGLIKLPDKKVIFTTNISDFGKIDPALVRPGRCFDLVHTRALNLTEAQSAARAANLPIPSVKGEYTLAELFNQGRRPVTLRRAGF